MIEGEPLEEEEGLQREINRMVRLWKLDDWALTPELHTLSDVPANGGWSTGKRSDEE